MPDREPEHLADLQKIMTGHRSTFESRMTFHYDFILKTFQSGNLHWMKILKDSYWFRRHALVIQGCERELEAERLLHGATRMTDSEKGELETYETIQAKIKASSNAARRAEQVALERWKQRHMGPRWYALIQEIWPAYKHSAATIRNLEVQLAALKEPHTDILPTLTFLEEIGFMENGALTSNGIMATEVNEGHGILMPLSFLKKTHMETAEERLAFLAAFVGESSNQESIGRLNVPETVRNSLKDLEGLAESCRVSEEGVGVRTVTNSDYWKLNYQNVEIVWRYLEGEELPVLAADYEVFEGNLIRILLKMGNVLQEWQTLATMSNDIDELRILDGAERLLVVGSMTSDSLYLRI